MSVFVGWYESTNVHSVEKQYKERCEALGVEFSRYDFEDFLEICESNFSEWLGFQIENFHRGEPRKV